MLAKVKKTIEEHRMLGQGDRLVTAVSGGPDSVALLKVLTMVADQYDLTIVAAHLNHGLRGEESDREEDFVRMLAKDKGIEFISGKVDMAGLKEKGKSLEELCREKRYAFLKQAAADYRATKIALGHHLRDQAETVLINFLRGSGSEGLRGMLPVREGVIIRPLLHITRDEILTFLDKEGLSFMTDSSNSLEVFLRNRIRHQLMPLLKEAFNPQVEANLARTAEIMRLDEDYMKRTVVEFLKPWGVDHGDEEIKVPLPEFLKLHEALQRRTIKTLLAGMKDSGQGVGYSHVKAAVALAQGRQGCGSLDLPGGVVLRREYDQLIFSRMTIGFDKLTARALAASAASAMLPFLYPVDIPGYVEVKEAGLTLGFRMMDKASLPHLSGKGRMVFMDYEKVRLPLAVRNAQPGDRFQPLGMEGTKKLKSFLIDEKVPRRRRQVIPLLVDREAVLWIAGMRMSERIRVTGETRLVLKVEIV